MRLPIFQFTWAFKNKKFGLVYPLEMDYDVQSFTYQVPVPMDRLTIRPDEDYVIKSLLNNEYFFPCQIAGKYVEVDGEVKVNDDDEIIISFKLANYGTISFKVDLYYVKTFYRKKYIPYRTINQYIGDYKSEFFKKIIFATITFGDISILDNFYTEREGLFIGYTPAFGEFDFNIIN